MRLLPTLAARGYGETGSPKHVLGNALSVSAKAQQPTLFELKEDRRPVADRSAAGCYLEPPLFSPSDPP